jgi:hypothetical protein
MIYSPERKKNNDQNKDARNHVYKNSPDQLAAHSVRADPPPSRPIGLFFLILLHVVPAFAGHQLLIFSPFRPLGPALTPCSHTDPISLRSPATARFNAGHS